MTSSATEAFVDLLSDDGLAAEFQELELLQRRLAARRATLVAEVGQRGAFRADGHASLAAWLRANGSWSSSRARRAKQLARLCRELPTVADALRSGAIGLDQADELARVFANPRCGDMLPASIALLLDHAARLSCNEFHVCVRRWELLADLNGAHRDRGDAVASRKASVTPVDRLGVVISASGGTALEAEELAAIFEWFCEREFQVDAAATTELDALPRTAAQRSFDALLEVFRRAILQTESGAPIPVTTNIDVDLHTFESALAAHGLADAPDDLLVPDPRAVRCETSRGTPVLPDDIVTAALSGRIRRVVVDSSGIVTNIGHRRRLFTGLLRDAAKLGARWCEFPGCTVPASVAQVDHVTEHARDRGATNTANAAVLCGTHNRVKHRQYQVRRDRFGQAHFQRADGTWLVPAGREPPDEDDLLAPDDRSIRDRPPSARDAA